MKYNMHFSHTKQGALKYCLSENKKASKEKFAGFLSSWSSYKEIKRKQTTLQ